MRTREESGLPIEAILVLSADDQELIEARVRQKVEECMATYGFQFELPESPVASSEFSLSSRFGELPNSDPGTWGYRDPELSELRQEADAATQALGEEELAALFGSSMIEENSTTQNGGDDCFSRAREAVYGDRRGVSALPGYQQLVDLQIESLDRVYGSVEGRLVVDEWAACMAEDGFEFKEWWEPPGQFGVDTSMVTDITDQERRTAESDARCRRESRLASRLASIDSEVQQEMLEEASGAVEAFTGALAAVVDRARAMSPG